MRLSIIHINIWLLWFTIHLVATEYSLNRREFLGFLNTIPFKTNIYKIKAAQQVPSKKGTKTQVLGSTFFCLYCSSLYCIVWLITLDPNSRISRFSLPFSWILSPCKWLLLTAVHWCDWPCCVPVWQLGIWKNRTRDLSFKKIKV